MPQFIALVVCWTSPPETVGFEGNRSSRRARGQTYVDASKPRSARAVIIMTIPKSATSLVMVIIIIIVIVFIVFIVMLSASSVVARGH
jgi:hypothetical protein